jgi:hypothetical protein
MTNTPDFPALVELAQRLEGKDRKTCELALYTLKKQDERLAKKDARIAELEAALKQSSRTEPILASRIANLMDALEPFADLEIVTAAQWEGDIALYAIAASKLRAARAAYRGEKE